jgi:hypothetical protein
LRAAFINKVSFLLHFYTKAAVAATMLIDANYER